MFLQKNKIYYEYLNKNSKKDILVFVHGLGVNWTVWKYQIEHFKALNYPVLYLDLRGHGKSEALKETSNYQLENFAKDINDILVKEKINKKIVLIGYSLGGMISLVFYRLFKDKVKKLVLLTTTYKNPVKTSRIKVSRFLMKAINMTILRLISKLSIKKTNNKEFDFTKLEYHPNAITAIMGLSETSTRIQLMCLRNMMRFNEFNTLKTINVPALIISARLDEFFPAEVAKTMHKYIKNSKLKVLTGTHAIVFKRPEIITKEISEFIKQ